MLRFIPYIAFFAGLLYIISCTNPAPNCDKFCKFRTNIKDGENNSNGKGFGEFNKNGSPKLCGPYPSNSPWPSFEVHVSAAGQKRKLCTNTGLPLNNNGITSWFNGDNCITQAEARQYQNSKPTFELANLANEFFLVKGKPGMCPGQCVVYKISGLPGDFRFTVEKINVA